MTAVLFTEKSEKPVAIDFRADVPFTLRSLQIFPARQPIQANARLWVKENGAYRMLSEFKLDRFNANLNVGFDPYAPVVVSVPATTASEFRLELANVGPGMGLSEVEFSSLPAVERYPEKTLAKMFQTPLPYWHEYQWAGTTGNGRSLSGDRSGESIGYFCFLAGRPSCMESSGGRMDDLAHRYAPDRRDKQSCRPRSNRTGDR